MSELAYFFSTLYIIIIILAIIIGFDLIYFQFLSSKTINILYILITFFYLIYKYLKNIL
jgi:hypothetical protein